MVLVAVVLVYRRSPLAPTPTAGIDWPKLFLPYIANVCFTCFNRVQRYVAVVSYRCCKSRLGMLHMLHMLQVFVQNVSFISRRMLQSFFIWILHMCLPHML
jgi:hypothetical protein